MVELIWEDKGLLRRISGAVSAEELDASAIRLQADRRLDDVRYIIHDFSAAGEIEVSSDQLEYMAIRASIALKRNPRVKVAFVGDNRVVRTLVAAFNGEGCEAMSCRRFDSLAEARAFVQPKSPPA